MTSTADLMANRPLHRWPIVPTGDIAVGTGADEQYRPAELFRESWFTTGTVVYVPRWEAGVVKHWEVATIVKITVSVRQDGVVEPWITCEFADGTAQGYFAYSLATHTVVNALD